MTTLGVMSDRIETELHRTDLTAPIHDEIRSAIQHYESMRTWWNERQDYVIATTVASTRFYTLSGCFILIDTTKIVYNGRYIDLEKKTWGEIDRIDTLVTPTTGAPNRFAVHSQIFRPWPVPNGSYTLLGSGLFRLGTLTGTASSNDWMIHGEELIRSRAKAAVRVNVMKDQASILELNAMVSREEPYYNGMEKIAHKSLEDAVLDYLATGRIKSYPV